MKHFPAFFLLLFFSLSLEAQTVPQKRGRQKQGANTQTTDASTSTQPTRQGTRNQTSQQGTGTQPGRQGTRSQAPVQGVNKPTMSTANANVVKRDYPVQTGRVEVSFGRSQQPRNDVKTTSSPAKAARCLTKEEVRGQRVESELIIADGAKAVQLLPGAVLDSRKLLQTGQFVYVGMDNRKPISLSTTTNLARQVSATVTPLNNKSVEEELRTKVQSLTSPTNMIGMPNTSSSSEVTVSTLQETVGVNIGASFFYMGVSATNNFKFSNTRYRYMYVYQFEQVCVPVLANAITSPEDVFRENPTMNNDWLYVREVKYGRRLYVLLESEYDLQKYSNELNGNLQWGAVSASLKVKNRGSSLSEKTYIRVLTQGGQFVPVTDPANIQAELDKYFKTPFSKMDIVPLSYKLTYLDGSPASMTTQAFLDGKHCLSGDKVKIRISKIECKKADDNKNNEEVYGTAYISLYNDAGKQVFPDGKTPVPVGAGMHTGQFSYGTKEAPLVIDEGSAKAKTFDQNQQGKFLDILVPSLDMDIEIKPVLKEKDNGLNADDDFVTQDRMKKSLRELLMEGSTSPVFEFRFKNAVMVIYFEIIPTF